MKALRTYFVPLIAIVVLVAWYFFIGPRLSEDGSEPAQDEKAGEKKKAGGTKAPPE